RSTQREVDAEERTTLRRVRQDDRATVERDQLLDDRQPEPRAAHRAGGATVRLPEALEHGVAQLGPHARAVIRDLHLGALAGDPQAAADDAARGHELERV